MSQENALDAMPSPVEAAALDEFQLLECVRDRDFFFWNALVENLITSGRLPVIETFFQSIRPSAPLYREAITLRALTCYQQGQKELAVSILRDAIPLIVKPFDLQICLAAILPHEDSQSESKSILTGLIQVNSERRAEALTLLASLREAEGDDKWAIKDYKQALGADVVAPDTLKAIAAGLYALKDSAACILACKKYLELRAADDEMLIVLGHSYELISLHDDAIEFFGGFLIRQPGHYEASHQLASALLFAGRADEVLETILPVIACWPDKVKPLLLAASALRSLGEYIDAIAILGQALDLDPAGCSTHRILGEMYVDVGLHDRAILCFEKARELGENEATIDFAIAVAYRLLGETDRSIELMNSLIIQFPERLDLYGSLLFSLSIMSEASCGRLIELASVYWQKIRKESCLDAYYLAPKVNVSNSDKKISVGILSADIGRHVVSGFLQPFLHHYNRTKFSVDLIGNTRRYESEEEEMYSLADNFYSVQGLDMYVARKLIRDKKYDVIIETSGFTRNSGLSILAHRCAPVQCHYIGYHATTGLDVIDYFIGDSEVTPFEFQNQFVEKLVHLPRTWLALGSSDSYIPAVDNIKIASPILGSFNQLSKIRKETLLFWAGALRKVPDAILVIKDRATVNESLKERVRKFIANLQVDPERILFYPATESREEHLDCYNSIDIALDATPWSSSTTAFDALSMGVPIVAIRGNCMSARMCSSILRGIGKSEWIANTPHEFSSIVKLLCDDLQALRVSKPRLQCHVFDSSLFDGVGLSESLSNLLEQMVNDNASV